MTFSNFPTFYFPTLLLGKDEVHTEQVYPKIYVGKTPMVDIGVANQLIKWHGAMEKEELRVELLDIANFRKVVSWKVGKGKS
ncbi:hypothetical protein RJD24_02450 [Bacillaceae bacterium IKA-2]|nr:hypothetical protein RJD24_02450 [Bacillaceae bacterium IKA-2]